MSLYWVIRLGLAVALFALVGNSRLLLGNRERFQRILENTPLAIFDVVAYNACCYLLVALPADPGVITAPSILAVPAVILGLQAVGGASLLAGASLVGATVLKRRVIGGQDTKEGLITSGVYQFARHPIYLGIVLISLSLALMTVNVDGMLVLPLVFLANFLQSEVEEKHDVGERFGKEYQIYRRTTPRFGPRWLWFALAGGVVAVLALGLPDQGWISQPDHQVVLAKIGIDGKIIHKPGYTHDSISVILPDGSAIVGGAAMNFMQFFRMRHRPIYMQDSEQTFRSWERLKEHGAQVIYPSHGDPFAAEELVAVGLGRIRESGFPDG